MEGHGELLQFPNQEEEDVQQWVPKLEGPHLCHQVLIHKVMDMEPTTDGKGVLKVTKWRTSQQKSATSSMWATIDTNAQATPNSMVHTIRENEHHSHLHVAAAPRASTTPGSQREAVTGERKLTHPPTTSEHNPQRSKDAARLFNQYKSMNQ